MKKHLVKNQKRLIDNLLDIIIFKSKSGQMFFIAAIIIVLLLFTLTVNYNWIIESIELKDYGELRDNFNKEVPKVANEAIYITTDPSKCKGANPDPHCPIQATQRFAKDYQKYANQKDPNFGLVSIIKDPVTGDIIIQNLLAGDKYIKIKTSDYRGESIKLLLSEDSRSTGTITLNGIGSIPVSVPVSSFGEGFTSTNIGNTQYMNICTDDDTCRPINLSDVSTLSKQITNSQDNKGNINYDVCPSDHIPNNC